MARRDASWWPLQFNRYGEAQALVAPHALFQVRQLSSGKYTVRALTGPSSQIIVLDDLLGLRVHLVQFAQEDDAIADEIINPHTPEVSK